MGCFSVPKNKKKTAGLDREGFAELGNSRTARLAPPSFRSTVRAILNAQRLFNSNPRLRSSHPSYRRKAEKEEHGLGLLGSVSPAISVSARTSSGTDLDSTAIMACASTQLDKVALINRPVLHPALPSQKLTCYRLPRPQQHVSASSRKPCPTCTKVNLSPSRSADRGSPLIKVLETTPVKPNASYPFPLVPRREAVPGVRFFTYEELAAACNNFSPDRCVGDRGACFAGMIKTDGGGEMQTQITVSRVCERCHKGYEEWLTEVSSVAQLHCRYLCKIIGVYAEEGNMDRLLVYERLPRGSLDRLLYARVNSPPLDWPSRIKIALGAAQGLAYLQEANSEGVVYRDFRASNIDVDMDFSSRLSGYAFATCSVDAANFHGPVIKSYCAPEITNPLHVSYKSIVWSFGILLLELLTGRQNMDSLASRDERNLVKWTRPFLMDEGRLFFIIDPKLQGRFPNKGAQTIADLALQCLQSDPSKRPTMREVSIIVKSVQEMRYTISRFLLKESTGVLLSGTQNVTESPQLSHPSLPSFQADRRSTERKIPTKIDLIESPQLKRLIIPSRSCATSFAMEEGMARQLQYSSRTIEKLQTF